MPPKKEGKKKLVFSDYFYDQYFNPYVHLYSCAWYNYTLAQRKISFQCFFIHIRYY